MTQEAGSKREDMPLRLITTKCDDGAQEVFSDKHKAAANTAHKRARVRTH
jgi:hypothetical protein